MGAVNAITKQFMKRNEITADTFNFLLYNGESVIQPDQLTELDSVLVDYLYKASVSADDPNSAEVPVGEPVEKMRDILKFLTLKTDGDTIYAILGIEAQTNIHYAMPVRNMMYDALSYSNQVKQIKELHRQNKDRKGHSGDEYLSGLYKEDRLYPVVTVVVYFGAEKWDGPTSLHDMLNVSDPRILSMVNDYRIHLITPESLSNEDLEKFHTNLREVLRFIKHSKDHQTLLSLVQTDQRYKRLDKDAAQTIIKCTNTNIKLDIQEGKVDMCKAIEDLRIEQFSAGEQQGLERGLEQGLEQGLTRGVQALINICRSFELKYEDVKARIISELAIKDDEAERYMQKYWR